jgi:hypothetical protein
LILSLLKPLLEEQLLTAALKLHVLEALQARTSISNYKLLYTQNMPTEASPLLSPAPGLAGRSLPQLLRIYFSFNDTLVLIPAGWTVDNRRVIL